MRRRLFINAEVWTNESQYDQTSGDECEGGKELVQPQPVSWFEVNEKGVFSRMGHDGACAPVTDYDTHDGSNDTISCKVIDLAGKAVLPGFHDSHIHVYMLGEAATYLDLSGCESIEEMQDMVRAKAKEKTKTKTDDGNDSSWIIGVLWSQEKLGRYPSADDLEDVAPGRCIFLWRVCWHIGVASYEALKRAGIDSDTTNNTSHNIPGGIIDMDQNTGRPTGILRETACQLITAVIKEKDPLVRRRHVERGLQKCLEAGLTTVHTNDANCCDIYRQLDQEGKLPIRVMITVGNSEIANTPTTVSSNIHIFPAGYRSESCLLSCHRAKIFSDGSLGAETAALRYAYNHDGDDEISTTTNGTNTDTKINNNNNNNNNNNRGVMIHTPQELTRQISKARTMGYRSEIHAIGDRAVETVLDALDEAGVTPDERPILTHAQILGDDLVRRMATMGVIANIQPSFVITDAAFAIKRLPPHLIPHSYIWKTLLESGVACAGGSDAPVETCRPLQGICDAMYRRSNTNTHTNEQSEEAAYLPEQCLTLSEAIDLYTKGGAWAAGVEDRSGIIKEQYEADFVVLDKAVLADPSVRLAAADVEQVWVAGVKRWDMTSRSGGNSNSNSNSNSNIDNDQAHNIEKADTNEDEDGQEHSTRKQQQELVLGGPYQPGKNGPRTRKSNKAGGKDILISSDDGWDSIKIPHEVACGGGGRCCSTVATGCACPWRRRSLSGMAVPPKAQARLPILGLLCRPCVDEPTIAALL